jgi:hypothetical protein
MIDLLRKRTWDIVYTAEAAARFPPAKWAGLPSGRPGDCQAVPASSLGPLDGLLLEQLANAFQDAANRSLAALHFAESARI